MGSPLKRVRQSLMLTEFSSPSSSAKQAQLISQREKTELRKGSALAWVTQQVRAEPRLCLPLLSFAAWFGTLSAPPSPILPSMRAGSRRLAGRSQTSKRACPPARSPIQWQVMQSPCLLLRKALRSKVWSESMHPFSALPSQCPPPRAGSGRDSVSQTQECQKLETSCGRAETGNISLFTAAGTRMGFHTSGVTPTRPRPGSPRYLLWG